MDSEFEKFVEKTANSPRQRTLSSFSRACCPHNNNNNYDLESEIGQIRESVERISSRRFNDSSPDRQKARESSFEIALDNE